MDTSWASGVLSLIVVESLRLRGKTSTSGHSPKTRAGSFSNENAQTHKPAGRRAQDLAETEVKQSGHLKQQRPRFGGEAVFSNCQGQADSFKTTIQLT